MRRVAVFAVAVVVAASCGSGKSIITAGRESPVVTQPVPITLPPGDTLPVGETLPPIDTTIAPTTTAAVLDTLPDCPTDALAAVTSPVQLTFWHGMNGPNSDELQRLTDAYNAGQSKVKVTLVEATYEQTIDKYLQSGQASRPDLVQMPEYMVQTMVDSQSVVPVEACMKSSGFDASAFLPTVLSAWATQGVQWSMPFNISNPVLFYNKRMFTEAGLDPDKPPVSLEDLRAVSEAIVNSGAAKYGLALDSGFDSGGGWYIEQWFAKAGEFYADNQNGRTARATSAGWFPAMAGSTHRNKDGTRHSKRWSRRSRHASSGGTTRSASAAGSPSATARSSAPCSWSASRRRWPSCACCSSSPRRAGSAWDAASWTSASASRARPATGK